MKNILGTGIEMCYFFCQHIYLFTFLCLGCSGPYFAGFFFLFSISIFTVIHFIKYLVSTSKKLGVVLGRFSSYQKILEPLPDGASDLMPYAMAYSYIPYSFL